MTLGQWIMLSYEAPISPTKMISWIVMRWNELMSCKWLATVCVCGGIILLLYLQSRLPCARKNTCTSPSLYMNLSQIGQMQALTLCQKNRYCTANARLPRVGWACRSRRTWRQSLGFHTSNWWKYIVIKTFEYILFRSNNISHHPITSNQYPICGLFPWITGGDGSETSEITETSAALCDGFFGPLAPPSPVQFASYPSLRSPKWVLSD